MSQVDILKVLKKNDGIERGELYDKVKHLFNRSSFSQSIKRLINSHDIIKIEKVKYSEGVKFIIIKFYFCE